MSLSTHGLLIDLTEYPLMQRMSCLWYRTYFFKKNFFGRKNHAFLLLLFFHFQLLIFNFRANLENGNLYVREKLEKNKHQL